MTGNAFKVDREFLAKELGFPAIAENSMWGVGDRDFIVEFMMWASLVMTHISRMAEDRCVSLSIRIDIASINDFDTSTGSSIMPQKKNPDSLELTV